MKLVARRITFCVLSVVFVGCVDTRSETDSESAVDSSAATTEHAHADKEPEDFDEAVDSLTTMKTSICEAFANGTPEDAHDLLHEVGHSLEQLPELAAKKYELSSDQLSAVNGAVEQLFDGFSSLDHTLHGGDEVDTDKLDEQLTEALSNLRNAVQ